MKQLREKILTSLHGILQSDSLWRGKIEPKITIAGSGKIWLQNLKGLRRAFRFLSKEEDIHKEKRGDGAKYRQEKMGKFLVLL